MSVDDKLIRHGSLMFFAATLGSVFNMLYQLYMVRNLSTVDYGILNSLLSLLLIVSVPAGTIQTVITKFSSGFHGRGQWRKIRDFLAGSVNKIFILGLALFLIIILTSKYISSFFQIPTTAPVIIVGLLMLVSFITPITLGGLQGLQMFGWLGVNGIISAGVKLVLGIVLISFGYRVLGALGAFFIANLIAFILSFLPLRYYISKEIETDSFSNSVDLQNKINFSEIYRYFIPVTMAGLCFMILINADIILVKHFFPPLEAGYYSVAQMVGKIIIFLPMSIITVMFPKVSNLHAQGKNTLPLLGKSLSIVGLICAGGALVCMIFPSLIIRILSGKEYIECISLARLFAVAMSFFALVYTLLFYQLSINCSNFIYPLIFFTILQNVLIVLFHKSLSQILYILCLNSVILFIVNLKMAFGEKQG